MLFVDYNTSSSPPYFSHKVAGVPVLTNTWAFPPSRMTDVLNLTYGDTSIDSQAGKMLGNLVLLQVGPHTQGLAPHWPSRTSGRWCTPGRRT